MTKKFRVIGAAGIMSESGLIKPGEVAELDEYDPRLPSWLAEGTLAELADETTAERKKPGPRPKDKEGAA